MKPSKLQDEHEEDYIIIKDMKFKVELIKTEDEIISTCKELNINDYGNNKEEAIMNLKKNIEISSKHKLELKGYLDGKKAERERIVKLIELINYTEDDITIETLIEKINGDEK